jgi:hypothetical protein
MIDQKVRVLKSDHSGIQPGDIGRICGQKSGGYAVDFRTGPHNVKTIWLAFDEVEILSDDPPKSVPPFHPK